MLFAILLSFAALLATPTLAQFPPPPVGIVTRQLQDHPGVSISYKQTCICESSARAWAGYVHMPTSYLSDIESGEPYNVSMFFWYFEAMNDSVPAPTGIYLAGGPGEASGSAALSEIGPCTVLADSTSTAKNPWAWNTNVNMLYIDQPVSTGFSYTSKINATLDLLFLGAPVTETGITPFDAYNGSVPSQNTTFLYGTFSEQDPQKTINSTLSAAKTLWHFSQAWFSGFPEYKTQNSKVSLWGNSYGGYWVPVTADYIVQQNHKISQGVIEGITIDVDTVGWTNGCVDQLYQGEWYPEQAYNNTYGLQVIPEHIYKEATHNFTKPGGCRDQILECRKLGDLYDPDQLNINATVNDLCVQAEVYCAEYVLGAYDVLSNRSDFDMAHIKPDPFPPTYVDGFLNQAWVQKDLGVPVNLTTTSLLANNVFLYGTGDPVRTAGLDSVERLLDSNVKVAMIYGDRDYRCPWNGAEKLSLAAKWTGAETFQTAGYEYIRSNASYHGGVVRQHGNLSFSRIFEAGHTAQAYQPETVFKLFNRAIFGTDLATGTFPTTGSNNNYTTEGPASSFGIKNELPPPPPFECNIWNVISSCTLEQYEALVNGTAEIDDFIVVKPAGGSPGAITGIL